MIFKLNKLDTNNINFFNILKNILETKKKFLNKIENIVKNIIHNIKILGNKALIYYTNKFGKNKIKHPEELKIKVNVLEKSFYKLDKTTRFILESTKNRINKFHENQKNNFINNFKSVEKDGNIIGQKLLPIKNIGLYIPGGKTIYPSSVFMNSVPAKLAGVDEINLVSPISLSNSNDLLFASIFISNINNFYLVGGAQAISALSFGSTIISKVDKICGPGNIYVSIAKKLIYSETGIDMIAGPSEIVIFCEDFNVNSDIIAIDLFSQSEHDELAQSIFISQYNKLIINLEISINNLLPFMVKKSIILNSIKNKCLLIKTKNYNESYNIINYIAPEHLIIISHNYKKIYKYIRNCGSIFLDKFTSESFGDYNSGLNHILPTYKNSRFSSGLGVYDFYKKINFLKITKLGFLKLYFNAYNFAKKEELFSHSESLKIRSYNLL